MALVSLKQSRADYSAPMGDEYGYGTCISLTDEQCQALGITTPPPAGTVFAVNAIAVAKSVTEQVSHDDRPAVRMELQLTMMELTPEKKRTREDTAKSLYPDME